MAEEFGFQKGVLDGRAVDDDEGLLAKRAVVVDGLGHQLLSRSALALDEDVRPRTGHRADELEDLPHAGRAADEVVDRVFLLPLLDQVADPLLQGLDLEGLFHGQVQGHIVEGLDQVLEGPQLDRFDRGLHIVEGGHDDDGGRILVLLQMPQDVQAVPVGQPDVQEDDVGPRLGRPEKPRFAVLRRMDLVPLLAQVGGQGLANEGVIVDDQDGFHDRSSQGRWISKAVPAPRLGTTRMAPLCCSTILRALASPRPKP